MSSFPASASKSFSSTPLKTYQDSGRELHRSKSVDYDSTGDSTYSLLSPIYHDSYESDEDVAAAHHVHQIDTSATQSDDARPLSPIRYGWCTRAVLPNWIQQTVGNIFVSATCSLVRVPSSTSS